MLYIKALAAPFTVNTMPEGTLKALADHGDLSEIMSADGGDCEAVWTSSPRRVSTSMTWPQNSRMTGPSRS